MPESIHWAISNQKESKVKRWVPVRRPDPARYVRKASRFNGVQIPLHECQQKARPEADEGGARPKRSLLDCFRHRGLRFHLVLHCFVL